jgi:hypothetical protein
MRYSYHCPFCDQRSTRRWNLDVHIKRKHGGYLHGRSSDPYVANNHPFYSTSLPSGHVTVADSVGDAFQPRYLPQRSTVGTSQYYTSPVYHPTHPMHDQSYGIGLSPETKQKIDEFTRLMNKYPQFNTNPKGIIRWAINCAVKGDNQFLDQKLEQLRIIDFYKA